MCRPWLQLAKEFILVNTVKFASKNVKMVAHRGCSGLEKENTNSAFVAAGNRSYFGVESDVHITSDGKYVIIHDDTTDRVTGVSYKVEETDFDTLRSLILLDRDGSVGRSDLKIPTLEEYILICKKYEKVAVLELKNAFKEEQVGEIVEIIKALGYLENVIFISFDMQNLIYLKKISPDSKAQFLTGEFTDTLIDTLLKNHLDIDIHYSQLNEKTVKAFKDANIEINCWTCDSAADGEYLASLGVDYITSNILE